MKKLVMFLHVTILIFVLTGCSIQKDTLKFTYEKTSVPNKASVSYEVNIGNEVGGAKIIAELWMNGECTESSPLILNNETKKIYISLLRDDRKKEGSSQGLNVQIEADEVSGSLLTYFELPQEVLGYSFKAYEDNEVIEVNAGEEVILATMAFDTGAGVRVIDCKSLVNEPERLKDYSCILVVRSAFTAEEIPPQTEA